MPLQIGLVGYVIIVTTDLNVAYVKPALFHDKHYVLYVYSGNTVHKPVGD